MRGLQFKEMVWLAGCQGLLCGSLVVVWLFGVRNESSASESAADSPSLVTAPESGIVLQTLGIGLQTLAVILFASLASAIVRTCLGANPAVVDTADDFTPAPQTVWPPALHVERIPLPAPVPPAFICPITMAPMANPAVTPRGTSYERDALWEWVITQHLDSLGVDFTQHPGGGLHAGSFDIFQHLLAMKKAKKFRARYPGGEARQPTNTPTHSASADAALSLACKQGPGTLELHQIAPNWALHQLMEAWIEDCSWNHEGQS